MQTFLFNPPMNLSEEDKWILAVTSFEATNPSFNMNNENNTFSFTTAGYWNAKGGQKTISKVKKKLLDLREENDIELHVAEVEKEDIR